MRDDVGKPYKIEENEQPVEKGRGVHKRKWTRCTTTRR